MSASSTRPPGGRAGTGRGVLVAAIALGVLLVGGAALSSFLGGGADPGPSPSGAAVASPTAAPVGSPSPAASPGSSPAPSPSPLPSPSPPNEPFPLAVVVDLTDRRVAITAGAIAKAVEAGTVVVPCGLERLEIAGAQVALDDVAGTRCVAPESVADTVRATKDGLGLLPVGLVDPVVKALAVEGADLFGAAGARAVPYPVIAVAPTFAGGWTAYDPDDVRTVVATGGTCPDRGVSLQAVVRGKGWDWTLAGGTARYTGVYMDTRFSGPEGKGWPVVKPQRTGNAGAVKALMTEADLTLNDFECPMIKGFRQHNEGTNFSIDPRVAGLLARHGVDVATLGSNHIGDQGRSGVVQTLDYFAEAGVKTVGAGRDLDEAIAPAVVEVRDVRFAVVGFDATGVSRAATDTSAGVFSYTPANVEAAMAAATAAADVVIVMPQWGFPEYHAEFTKGQLKQMPYLYGLGADLIIGQGTHWASAAQLEPGGDAGYRFTISSMGNFLFHQHWSRQTMEGVIPELAFVGERLVRIRLHPYVVVDWAQPNLTDPTKDGAYVLDQVWEVSRLP